MQSKIHFFDKNPCFWRPFWRPHLHIVSPLQQKPFECFSRRAFFFIKLKFKLHQIHLVRHKLIREMGVNSSDKAFRTIPHPSIYNVRSYILHTGRRKSMAQVILLFNLHYHKQLFTLYFQSITSHK